MYAVVLAIHNIIRWVVLIFALYALYRAFSGWLGRKDWSQADRRAGMFFTISLDIQLLLGLLLYIFLSGLTRTYLTLITHGAVVPVPEAAFFGLEHLLLMVIAIAIVHFGSVLSRRLVEPVRKFRVAAITYAVSLIMIIIAIPWWRPLLRV
jgi:hypothetical protein